MIDDSGLLSFSVTSQKAGTTQVGNNVYTREAMQADRSTRSKDKSAPTAGTPVGADGYYLPPSETSIPETPYGKAVQRRSEEHTSELQSLMRNSYAVFCLKKKTKTTKSTQTQHSHKKQN